MFIINATMVAIIITGWLKTIFAAPVVVSDGGVVGVAGSFKGTGTYENTTAS